jgi:hypothetical protein
MLHSPKQMLRLVPTDGKQQGKTRVRFWIGVRVGVKVRVRV